MLTFLFEKRCALHQLQYIDSRISCFAVYLGLPFLSLVFFSFLWVSCTVLGQYSSTYVRTYQVLAIDAFGTQPGLQHMRHSCGFFLLRFELVRRLSTPLPRAIQLFSSRHLRVLYGWFLD